MKHRYRVNITTVNQLVSQIQVFLPANKGNNLKIKEWINKEQTNLLIQVRKSVL